MSVPEHILNFKRSAPKSTEYKAAVDKTNLLITVNPNVKYDSLTPAGVKKLYTALDGCMSALEAKLKSREWLKPKIGSQSKRVTANLIYYKYNVEIGEQLGYIHAHAVAKFDKVCMIKADVLRADLKRCLAKFYPNGGNPHLDIKQYNDSDSIIQTYVDKQKITSQS